MNPPLHRLQTRDDVLAAAEWCLSGIPAEEVRVMGEVLRPLASRFSEDDPEVSAVLADMRYPRNRKSSWSLACAILVEDAWARDDVEAFWAAGIEVLKAWQQGKRGKHHNRNVRTQDALDVRIAAYRADFPVDTHTQAFYSMADIANAPGAFDPLLIEYDYDKDELVCQLDPDDEALTNIGLDEFKRRFRHATGCM